MITDLFDRYLVATTTIWSGASYIYTKDAVKILSQDNPSESFTHLLRQRGDTLIDRLIDAPSTKTEGKDQK